MQHFLLYGSIIYHDFQGDLELLMECLSIISEAVFKYTEYVSEEK